MNAARVRATVATLIVAVEKGASLSSALSEAEPAVSENQRALLRQMAYGTFRHYYRLTALRQQLLEKPLKPKEAVVNALLLAGLYQLAYMRIPPHAVIQETVNATRILNKVRAKGLVNAILRQMQRQQETLLEKLEHSKDNTVRYDHPQWFIKCCKHSWPEKWQDILQKNNEQAPMALRVNRRLLSVKTYMERLTDAGIPARASTLSDCGIILEKACSVEKLPGFSKGMVSVQDEAAQLSAPLMQCQPGERILDACAAPGGKACHLLEHTEKMELHALDVDKSRLARVRENLDRLKLEATLICGDALTPESWWDGKLYDRILLDAPCSATGVIRRHPDIKLLRRESDIRTLTALQQNILKKTWSLLKPGGILVYATCSVLPQENSNQIEYFLTVCKDATLEPVPEKYQAFQARYGIQFFPESKGNDGFFYSVLRKNEV